MAKGKYGVSIRGDVVRGLVEVVVELVKEVVGELVKGVVLELCVCL